MALVSAVLPSCEHFSGAEAARSQPPAMSSKEVDLIRQHLVSLPLPDDPSYIRTRQKCFFFVEHPKDGSMVPVGVLQEHSYLILRERDGEWADVQLTSGQIGSVMSVNFRELTPQEGSSGDYLKPQPAMKPLTLPQASTDGAGIDGTLLGS